MCMKKRKTSIPRNRNCSFQGRRRNDLKRKRQRDAIEGKAGDITLWAGNNTHSGWQLDNTLNVNESVHQRLGGEKQRGGWKEKCGERKALGTEYLKSHTCISHTPTCTHICWNRDKLLARFCCLRAFFCEMKSVSVWESLALHSCREMSWKRFWPRICLITFQPISPSIKKDWVCLVRLGVKECRGHRYGLGLCVPSTRWGCVLLCLFGCCKRILLSLWGISLQAF